MWPARASGVLPPPRYEPRGRGKLRERPFAFASRQSISAAHERWTTAGAKRGQSTFFVLPPFPMLAARGKRSPSPFEERRHMTDRQRRDIVQDFVDLYKREEMLAFFDFILEREGRDPISGL